VAELPPTAGRRTLIEAVVASTVGTTIEWYDFFLYGIAAADVFPGIFLPEVGPYVGQLLSFLTFTAGFLARPVGGVVFGHLGDRVGRKATLVATLLLMGVSTVLIGVLPGHSQLGVAAPLLLLVLRCAQGLGVGGEWGGSVLLALEYGHRGRRGFLASWPQAGVPLGLLAAAGAVALCKHYLSAEDYLAWGWRVPFFLSGLLIVVGLVIRTRLLETPLFQQLQAKNAVSRAPIKETLARHWPEVLLAAGSRMAENACFYLFSTYLIAYNKDVLGLDAGLVLLAVNLAAAVEVFTIPLYGALSDRISRKRACSLGLLALAFFAPLYYALLGTREPAAVVLAVAISLAGIHALLYSVQASLIPELFGTRLRYTGSSLGYQLASPFAGGLAPIVAGWVVHQQRDNLWLLPTYIFALALLSLLCVHLLAETSKKDISGE